MEFRAIRAVLLDIEGTTTDVRFVHETLFGVARRELPGYVSARWGSPDVEQARDAVARDEGRSPAGLGPDALAAALLGWIDNDRKETSLKELQGKIWREGYASGAIRGHVYPDVAPALRRWREAGITMAIFSSGSVEAQELLFRHSEQGDLTSYIAAYFDTKTGPKRVPSSYRRIAAALEVPPEAIRFLSDIVAELDAAADAGMQTTQLLRGELAGEATGRHGAVASFDELHL